MGCSARFRRKESRAHEDVCPKVLLHCEFGCEALVLREAMDAHLRSATGAHMTSMMRAIKASRSEIHVLLRKQKAAEVATTKLRDEVRLLKQKLKKQQQQRAASSRSRGKEEGDAVGAFGFSVHPDDDPGAGSFYY